jgi:hypothetical protein
LLPSDRSLCFILRHRIRHLCRHLGHLAKKRWLIGGQSQ